MTWTAIFGRRRSAPSALALMLLLASAGRAEAGFYSVADLGNLGSNPPAIAGGAGLNASGQVVGYYSGGPTILGFIASGGPMTSMGTLGGSYSVGGGINDSGVAVGYSYVTGNASANAFTYSNGTMTDVTATLGITLGGTTTVATAISNSGQIAGYGSTDPNSAAGGSTHAFFYNGTTTIDLSTLYGPTGISHAYAINNTGQVVGNTTTVSGQSHAFLYSSGTGMVDLGTLGNAPGASTAYHLNAGGQVVGDSAVGDGSVNHAFLYNGSAMIDLTPGAALADFQSKAYGIDTAGDIVGYYTSGSFSGQHGFLYSGGTLTDLNSLLALGSGWTITGAYGINDAGQIAAIGVNGAGQSHALLLSAPGAIVPEPPTIALLCSGAVLGVGIRKRTSRGAAALAADAPAE